MTYEFKSGSVAIATSRLTSTLQQPARGEYSGLARGGPFEIFKERLTVVEPQPHRPCPVPPSVARGPKHPRGSPRGVACRPRRGRASPPPWNAACQRRATATHPAFGGRAPRPPLGWPATRWHVQSTRARGRRERPHTLPPATAVALARPALPPSPCVSPLIPPSALPLASCRARPPPLVARGRSARCPPSPHSPPPPHLSSSPPPPPAPSTFATPPPPSSPPP